MHTLSHRRSTSALFCRSLSAFTGAELRWLGVGRGSCCPRTPGPGAERAPWPPPSQQSIESHCHDLIYRFFVFFNLRRKRQGPPCQGFSSPTWGSLHRDTALARAGCISCLACASWQRHFNIYFCAEGPPRPTLHSPPNLLLESPLLLHPRSNKVSWSQSLLACSSCFPMPTQQQAGALAPWGWPTWAASP